MADHCFFSEVALCMHYIPCHWHYLTEDINDSAFAGYLYMQTEPLPAMLHTALRLLFGIEVSKGKRR